MLKFDGKVAIITGAARGLGREYALLLASRGATVIVNDLGGSRDGTGRSPAADATVEEIRKLGGRAIANYNSVEEGEKIVAAAIDNFGRIDIIINNAGILRDKSMLKITEDDWDLVHRIHLRSAFIICKAAWPYMRKQNYGRIVMTSSPSGVYGNFGQANYSSAKLGLVSLAKTLSVEGLKYDIKCNSILPVAASRLTEDLMPEDVLQLFQPQYVAPIVAYLCHDNCPVSGEIFEAAGGYYGRYLIRRSKGKVFRRPETVMPEDIENHWSEIVDMDGASTPASMQEHTFKLMAQLQGLEGPSNSSSKESSRTADITPEVGVFRYTTQDAILYALSIGVSVQEEGHLNYLYEANDEFKVFPTFGASVSLNAIYDHETFAKAITDYGLEDNIIRALHGEQYLKVLAPIPESGTLVSKTRILDVLDKGTGALIIIEVQTFDQQTNKPIFYNQMSALMLGSGNFGGSRNPTNPEVVECVPVPDREPDAVIEQTTNVDQAALFRLCGDRNPLHIDPMFSIVGGFERPILHGLCMLGYAVRHALREFANYDASILDAVKARFVGTIIPGQTIQTRLWRSSVNINQSQQQAQRQHRSSSGGNSIHSSTVEQCLTRVHFECYCKETAKKVVALSYVDLKLPPSLNQATPAVLLTHSQQSSRQSSSLSFGKTQTSSSSPSSSSSVASAAGQSLPPLAQTSSIANSTGLSTRLQTLPLDVSTSATAQTVSTPTDNNSSNRNQDEQKSNVTFKMTDQDEKLLKSIPISGIKSDLVFTLLGNRMHEEPEFVRKIRASYQFNITSGGQIKSTWTAENKSDEAGAVYQGTIRVGKPDCIATVDDEDFIKLMFGKLNPQRAFMLGKLKVKGNIMLLQKLNSLWLELVKSGKAPEFPYIIDLMSKTDIIAGIRSEVMIIELIQRLIRLPYLCNELTKVGFVITKDGKTATEYTLDFTQNKQTGIFERGLPKGDNYCILTMSDETFTLLTYHRFTLEDAIQMGKVQLTGDSTVPQKLSIVFKTPTSRVRL